MTGKAKAPGVLRRVARLLIGSSRLRRPSDRIEGALVALLSLMFLACAAAAALLGSRFCQIQSAEAARVHPHVAVVSKVITNAGTEFPTGEVIARWQAPDGQHRSGILTAATAPGLWGAQAGTRIRVWLSPSGNPVPSPSTVAVVVTATVIATAAWGVTGLALGACYLLCRALLDRRRLAGWESDWALTGPRWTTPR
jgi:hypothetical protein